MQAMVPELMQLSHFTPYASTFGGLLIGAASSFLLLTTGHIAGISGLVKAAVFSRPSLPSFRPHAPAFVSGMLAGGVALKIWSPQVFGSASHVIAATAATAATAPLDPMLSAGLATVAGLLVGVGTKLGSGCTSGHGVCGLPRLSPRSWVAVGTFFPAGIASAMMAGSMLGNYNLLSDNSIHSSYATPAALAIAVGFGTLAVMGRLKTDKKPETTLSSLLVHWSAGAGIAGALGLSGMTNSHKVLSFLDPLHHVWDPSLACVLGGAVGLNFLTFALITKRPKPILEPKFEIPTRKDINLPLVAGSGLFGLGWGLGGLCPGPAFVGLASGDPIIWLFCGSHLAGVWLADKFLPAP